VLSINSDDYCEGVFDVKLEIEESKLTTAATIYYEIELNQDEIRDLVVQGKAAIYLNVICARTYLDKLEELSLDGGILSYTQGELNGAVDFKPLVCATSEINDFRSGSLHDEFSDISWSFENSAILAIGSFQRDNFGLAKLQALDSIFDLVAVDGAIEGELQVRLEQDRIQIATHTSTKTKIEVLRSGGGLAKRCLLNGVYLPVVMEVLSCLSSESASYEGYRWFNVFSAKCEHAGISIDNPELLVDSQKLLKLPLQSLLSSKELFDK